MMNKSVVKKLIMIVALALGCVMVKTMYAPHGGGGGGHAGGGHAGGGFHGGGVSRSGGWRGGSGWHGGGWNRGWRGGWGRGWRGGVGFWVGSRWYGPDYCWQYPDDPVCWY